MLSHQESVSQLGITGQLLENPKFDAARASPNFKQLLYCVTPGVCNI